MQKIINFALLLPNRTIQEDINHICVMQVRKIIFRDDFNHREIFGGLRMIA
jgi:hypothetical protein